MKRTVIVIAHNESSHIAECLVSLEKQSIKADETIVVCHNCTDDTADIARTFENVRVEELQTEESGPIFARIRGFELATNEVIACIDGDSIAHPKWLESVTAPLAKPEVVGVGGPVGFKDEIWWNVASFFFFYVQRLYSRFYFWGASFACKKSAYEGCGGLRPFIPVRKELGLHYWAEDCYLSLAFEKEGKIEFAPSAVVVAYPSSLPNDLSRGFKQNEDKKKLFRYFETKAQATQTGQ